jgi:iron complex transport system substrate-binding protein
MSVFARSSAFVYAQENSPQRIISLGPAITEELYLLGADDKLIGCTVYCQRPPEAKNKTKVGTAIEVNLEKIVALKPDVVFATSLTSPQAKEKLKDLGIKVVDFPAAKSFSEICGQFLRLGRIIGNEEEADRIVNIAKAKVDSIRKKAEVLPKPRVFVQIGARPLVTVTADSFVNDFIEFAGGVNIAKGLKSLRYSKESVIKDNPDVIIIVTMGIGAEKEKEIWQRYKSLKAAREDRIYIVDSDLLCSPTPVSFAETLEKISQILHSEDEQKNN